MQTPEQVRESANRGVAPWKVVASVATVAAFGFGSMAIADPGQSEAENPPAIELDDERSADQIFSSGTQPDWEIVFPPTFTPGDDLDSPLASADLGIDTADSLDSADDSAESIVSTSSPDVSMDSTDVSMDSTDVSMDSTDVSMDSTDVSMDSADNSIDSP